MRLQYYRKSKQENPENFHCLYLEAVNFFQVTPLTSLSHICFKQIATTPPKTSYPKRSPNRQTTLPRLTLSFLQADEDYSDDNSSAFDSPKIKLPARVAKQEAKTDTMTISNGITVTTFPKEERHKKGLMTVDYIAVKYRANSLVDVFQKNIKHNVGQDGLYLEIEVPKFDGETKQHLLANCRTTTDGNKIDILSDVLIAMSSKIGSEYVKALLMQITIAADNDDQFEKLHVSFKRKVIPESMELHKLPVTVTAETGKYDVAKNLKTYTYKVVDYVYIFKVANSERFIKRYAAYNEDDLADAFDDLDVSE